MRGPEKRGKERRPSLPMSFPTSPPSVPAVVRRFAAGRRVRAVWTNELGGVTFRIGPGTEFVKVAGVGTVDFADEARRLRWAAQYTPVPSVLGFGLDGDRAWLRTGGLPGVSAVHPRWLAAPDVAVRAIAEGCAHCTTRCRSRRVRSIGRRPAGWLGFRRPGGQSSATPAGRSGGGLSRRRVFAQHADR